jgi:hypothetical protein
LRRGGSRGTPVTYRLVDREQNSVVASFRSSDLSPGLLEIAKFLKEMSNMSYAHAGETTAETKARLQRKWDEAQVRIAQYEAVRKARAKVQADGIKRMRQKHGGPIGRIRDTMIYRDLSSDARYDEMPDTAWIEQTELYRRYCQMLGRTAAI